MNLRPRRNEEPDVSLTPLIDIVFLLLIFFMVSTTFRKETELTINLPEASATPSNSEPRQLEIAVDVDGRYELNGELLADQDLDTLVGALTRAGASADDPNLPVLIRADANAAHQAVVTAMDAVGQAGFRRLGIVTTHRNAAAAE